MVIPKATANLADALGPEAEEPEPAQGNAPQAASAPAPAAPTRVAPTLPIPLATPQAAGSSTGGDWVTNIESG